MTKRALSPAQFGEDCQTCGLGTKEWDGGINNIGTPSRHHVGETHQQGLNYDDDHDPVLRR